MDRRSPARTLKQRIATTRRLGRGRIALRLDLQRRLKLRQLTRGLPDAPILTLFARHGPAAALWSHAFWRHGRFSWYTGGAWALTWLVRAWKCWWWWDAHAGDDACHRIAGARTRYTLLWKFPTHAPLAVEWPCGSAYAEGWVEEG